jgi:S-adenosylmethionine-dependent methyltransferase
MTGRGRVRFELLLGQVLDALPRSPASVVDAGGGTGQLAVPLARLGYHVTVVDTSAAMLATCAQRAAEDPALAARVATVQGDVVDVAALLGPASQDAALCHEVVTCVDDPAAVLGALAGVLRPGGVLSLTFANRDWLVLRAGRRGDYPGALRLLDDVQADPGPQPPSSHRAATVAELDAHLAKAGFEVAGVFGVSVFAEGRDDDLDAAPEALLELERRVAGREPYRSSAQVVHLVARRSTATRTQVRR